jgi:hypothetical protein
MKYALLPFLALFTWACTQTDKAGEKDSILKTWVVTTAEVDSNYFIEEENSDHLELIKKNSLGATMEFRKDSTLIIKHVGKHVSVIDTSMYMITGDQLTIINQTRFYEETGNIKKLNKDSLVLRFDNGEKEEWFTIRLVPKG